MTVRLIVAILVMSAVFMIAAYFIFSGIGIGN